MAWAFAPGYREKFFRARLKISNGASFAHNLFPSFKQSKKIAQSSGWSRVAYKYNQGCSLVLDGAQRVASNKEKIRSGSMSLLENARGLLLFLIRSKIGCSI